MLEATIETMKAKAPARPRAKAGTIRKPVVKKKTVIEAATAILPSHEQVSLLAYEYWAERGWHHGHADQDWLRAERELMKGMHSL
jgi:hypothetical protein